MKRSFSSSSSSLRARTGAILLVIVCCCSLLLPCPCYASDKLGLESGGGGGLGTQQGWMPPSPLHNGGYGTSCPQCGHDGAAPAPSMGAHRKDLQVSRN